MQIIDRGQQCDWLLFCNTWLLVKKIYHVFSLRRGWGFLIELYHMTGCHSVTVVTKRDAEVKVADSSASVITVIVYDIMYIWKAGWFSCRDAVAETGRQAYEGPEESGGDAFQALWFLSKMNGRSWPEQMRRKADPMQLYGATWGKDVLHCKYGKQPYLLIGLVIMTLFPHSPRYLRPWRARGWMPQGFAWRKASP